MSIQLAVSAAGNINSPYGHFQVVGPDGNEIEVQGTELNSGHWQVTFRDHDGSSPNPIPYFLGIPHTVGISNEVAQEGFYNAVALPSLDGQRVRR